eukprot:COSAG04_NODE_729_length_10753_cov_2.112728_3_plen_148_part_00
MARKNAEPLRAVGELLQQAGRYRAPWDFAGDKPKQLSLRAGDIVRVLKRPDNNWVVLRKEEGGEEGLAPTAYIKPLRLFAKRLPCLRAAWDFPGDQLGQLPLSSGDVVNVLGRPDDQWTVVRAESGQEGLVPSAFLKPVVSNDGGSV